VSLDPVQSHRPLLCSGKLQQVTATQTGINPVLTTSANLFGGVAGKLILAPIHRYCLRGNRSDWQGNRYLSQDDQVFAHPTGMVVVIVLVEAWSFPESFRWIREAG